MPLAGSIIGGELYPAKVLRDGAVGYWRLGEPSGTVAIDSVASPHNGTYTGGVTLAQVGPLADGITAALFDGTGFVSIPNIAAANVGLGSYSLEAWVKRAPGIAASEFVIQNHQSTGTGGGGEIFMGASGNFVGRIGAKQVVSLVGFADGAWHHVVLVMNRAIVNGGQFYVDGVTSGAAIDLTSEAAINFDGSDGTAILIGKRTTGNFFVGRIADPSIYPTALTARQIAEHYGLRLAVTSGLRVGGTAPIRQSRHVVGSGGVRIGGSAPIRQSRHIVGSGGVRVGGAGVVRGISVGRQADAIVRVGADDVVVQVAADDVVVCVRADDVVTQVSP